jgi:hypothetical protein
MSTINNSDQERIFFSTLDFVNFCFSLALSVASIVLAITAIIMSKNSEHFIVGQNIKNNDLQNDIFRKTLEVLCRIESSSGINEKRIDDIAKSIMSSPIKGPKEENEIKKIIKEGLYSEGGRGEIEERKKRLEEITVARKRKGEFQSKILAKIANIGSVKAEKIGDGSFDSLGDDLVDGIFHCNGKRFSVSTFYIPEPDKTFDSMTGLDRDTFENYFKSLVKELVENRFDQSFLVFSEKITAESDFMKLFKQTLATTKDEIVERIVIISGNLEDIILNIEKYIS